jgi:hypothetical protein
MKPLERLLTEQLPTGTFGGHRPKPPEPEPDRAVKPHREPGPDPLAAQHRADLIAALDAHDADHRATRHLRAVS